MTNIRKDALKAPLSHIVIISLFAVGGVSIPLDWFFALFINDKLIVKLLSETVIRIILSVIAVIFIFKYGFQKALSGRFGLVALLMTFPALLVAVNNFPIIGVATGNVGVLADSGELVVYILFCFAIGFYEELVFRGLVFPLFYLLLKKYRKSVFWTVAGSSAVFGIIHFINILGGAGVGATFLQAGYSFLIGAMCAICMMITGNLFVAAILHSVYDIGGLFLNYVAVGNQWDTVTVAITAVLGTIVAVYMTALCFKIPPERIETLYGYASDTEEQITNK